MLGARAQYLDLERRHRDPAPKWDFEEGLSLPQETAGHRKSRYCCYRLPASARYSVSALAELPTDLLNG